jgi:hypothetical protein
MPCFCLNPAGNTASPESTGVHYTVKNRGNIMKSPHVAKQKTDSLAANYRPVGIRAVVAATLMARKPPKADTIKPVRVAPAV